MGDLAGVGSGDRLHVLRPLPARLEGAASHGLPGDLHDLRLAVSLERPDLVRRVEILHLDCCHNCSFRSVLRPRWPEPTPEPAALKTSLRVLPAVQRG